MQTLPVRDQGLLLAVDHSTHQAFQVKNLPATQETRVLPLGGEGPLEKEMATHSSIFAWEIPWTEVHGGQQSTGITKNRT